jgi:small conductance mechanosensitive channel
MPQIRRLPVLLLLCISACCTAAFAQATQTTGLGDISLEELDIRLLPLTSAQLETEAAGWQAVLQETVADLGHLEIDIFSLQEAESAGRISEADAQQLQQHYTRAQELREQRNQNIDRMRLVLDHLSQKLGLTETGDEQEFILHYRRYIASVNGFNSRVVDASTLWTEIGEWLMSPEGGLRILRHLAILLGATWGFWLLGKLLGKAVRRGLDLSGRSSVMLKNFAVRNIPRVTVIFGFLFGLALLNINVTPVLAVIGGMSFVVAFALQDSLSNFASGIMIMLYKPFDVDDVVDVAGIEGVVKSMTLVSTTITTFDNKVLIVPNNSIWGSIITNVTGSQLRRVDLVFGIGYADDMDKAEKIIHQVVQAQPAVLDEPEPLIKVHELADSSVNFICRPWVKTDDYWDVYWDITRQVKERFDAEGVSIPFPQRDVYVHQVGGDQ